MSQNLTSKTAVSTYGALHVMVPSAGVAGLVLDGGLAASLF